jgi:hypothetical protein
MTVDCQSTDDAPILRWPVAVATGRRPVQGSHPRPTATLSRRSAGRILMSGGL